MMGMTRLDSAVCKDERRADGGLVTKQGGRPAVWKAGMIAQRREGAKCCWFNQPKSSFPSM